MKIYFFSSMLTTFLEMVSIEFLIVHKAVVSMKLS